MSMSARKRRNLRVRKRLGRKQFRQAERALMRGDHPHKTHFSDSWSGHAGMRQRDLP